MLGGNFNSLASSLRHSNAKAQSLNCIHFYSYKQAAKKVIENNPTIALKSLVTPREGELEQQEILLKFAEGTYVHHRAMRDIWRQLSDSEKEQLVPSKSQVNQAYSTSFGLHVAVITADDPPKFLFCRRANRGKCKMVVFICQSRQIL